MNLLKINLGLAMQISHILKNMGLETLEVVVDNRLGKLHRELQQGLLLK